MGKDEIIAVLREYKREHAEEYGILALGVFGSVARDEAREDSDVDICIQTRTPDAFATHPTILTQVVAWVVTHELSPAAGGMPKRSAGMSDRKETIFHARTSFGHATHYRWVMMQ